jgi:hypothetical protein
MKLADCAMAILCLVIVPLFFLFLGYAPTATSGVAEDARLICRIIGWTATGVWVCLGMSFIFIARAEAQEERRQKLLRNSSVFPNFEI